MQLKLALLAIAWMATSCASENALQAGSVANAPQVQLVNAGDAAQGRAYAQGACASCHAVEAGQTSSPVSIAPPFEELANTPGMTAIAVRAWLNSPHENMPQLIIAAEDADNLSAYILSLKRRSE